MISSIPKWVSNLFGNTMRPNVKVLETSYISPQIKRIRFQGDISKWSFQIGYASVVRVSETEFRNYTIANHNKEKGVFEIIFHIHAMESEANTLIPYKQMMNCLSVRQEVRNYTIQTLNNNSFLVMKLRWALL